jgi:hypothetical protein
MWQISLNHIREVRWAAADLLSLMCFFNRHAIPETLLQEKGSGQAEGEVQASTIHGITGERGGGDPGAGDPSERNPGIFVDKAKEYEKDVSCCETITSSRAPLVGQLSRCTG